MGENAASGPTPHPLDEAAAARPSGGIGRPRSGADEAQHRTGGAEAPDAPVGWPGPAPAHGGGGLGWPGGWGTSG